MLRYRMVETRRGNRLSVLSLGPDGGGSPSPDGGGDKPPVFLIHPINLRKECWLDLMRGLAGGRPCVAVDLAGHGESTDGEQYSLSGWVSDCHDVIDALGLDRLHLVGGSLGGTIALCLAAELPAAAVSVTAIGASVGDEPAPATQPATGSAPPPDLAELLDRDSVGGMFATLAAAAVAPGSPAPLVTTVRHLTNSHGEAAIRAIWQALLAADASPWLPGIACPVLVVTGEHDATCPADHGRRLARIVAGRFEAMAGVGHLPMLEDAAAVLALLVPHLESTESKVGTP